MKVQYEIKSHSIVDYVVGLLNREIEDLPNKPLETTLLFSEGCEKKFRLRVSSTDDDTNLKMHCHPSLTGWNWIKDIHTTISPVAYEILNKTGKYVSGHDHGNITIMRI